MNVDPEVRLDRVLITGGAGFIGRHLAAELRRHGAQVLITARPQASPSDSSALAIDVRDAAAVARLLDSVRPSAVFNLVGRRPQSSTEDPEETIELNVIAAMRVVRESARVGVARVVLVGSAEEYGDQSMPVSEDAPLDPRTIYGAAKAAMTLHALALHRSTGAPVTVVRPFSVYGPGAPTQMFVAEAMDRASRGLPFEMTEGTQRRDLIHVDDVVSGLIAAVRSPQAVGEVFNLGSGVSHALRDVAHAIWRISEAGGDLRIGVRAPPPGDLKETRARIDKAERVLGWRPRLELEDGLRATWLAMTNGGSGGAAWRR